MSDEFKLIPYSFVPLIENENKQIITDKNMMAFCPPFHILLDHTIAVIWEFFNIKQTKVYLTGSQISWALRFLEGLANETECCSVDVKKAIKCLRNGFVNCISQEILSTNANIEERNYSGDENEDIQEQDIFSNEESFGSDDSECIFKSVLLKDMFNEW